MSLSTLRTNRAALAAAPAAGLVLLLAGCGGGASAAASSTNNGANGQSTNADNGTGNNSAGRAFPGANGQIAAVDGKTLQVQNTTTQTAVTYTASTKLSQTVDAAKADLAVGKCISVRPVQSATDNSGAAPTTADDSTPVAAGSVSISDAVNGSCTGGFGGGLGGGNGGQGFRGRGQGAAGGTATGAPSDQAPTGAPGGTQGFRGGAGGRGADGKITKIDGDTVTIEMQQRPFNQGAAAAGSAASATPTVTTVTRTVTLSSATTYTKTASASSSDLKVGKCVTALGSTDSNGTLAATSIALRPATNGSCTTGFGGRGQNAGNQAGAPAATTNS